MAQCIASPASRGLATWSRRSAVSVARARSAAPRSVIRCSLGEKILNSITVAINNSPLAAGKAALAKAQAGSYDEAAVKAELERTIASGGVVVYSWSGCPFCKKAKALLDDVGATYKAIELDQMGQEGKAIRAELAAMTGRTSMPNIFIKGTAVGGCNDGPGVMTLNKEGKLLPMLEAAGAL